MLSTYWAFSLLERIGEEPGEHVDQLVQNGAAVGLDVRFSHVEEDAFAQDDVSVLPDGDLRGVAHDLHDAVADLLKDGQAQHRDGLHLAAHLPQIAVGRGEILLLLGDERLLLGYGLALAGDLLGVGVQLFYILVDAAGIESDLLLLTRQRLLRALQIGGHGLQPGLGLLHLRKGRGKLQSRLVKDLLRVAQIVAGDQILDIAQQHQEEQDQRHRGHHVRVGRPEALLPLRGGHKARRTAGTDALHRPLSPDAEDEACRRARVRSRTATSSRSTDPRRL